MVRFIDLLRRVLQREAGDTDIYMQNVRRRREAERVKREKEKEIMLYVRKKRKQQQLALQKLMESQTVEQPRISHIKIADVLGFQPKPQRRKK